MRVRNGHCAGYRTTYGSAGLADLAGVRLGLGAGLRLDGGGLLGGTALSGDSLGGSLCDSLGLGAGLGLGGNGLSGPLVQCAAVALWNLTLAAAVLGFGPGLAAVFAAGFAAALTGASFLKSFKGPEGPRARVS